MSEKYLLGFGVALSWFVVANFANLLVNLLHFFLSMGCCDQEYSYGWPFAFLYLGGYGSDRGFFLSALLRDVVAVLVAGLIVGTLAQFAKRL